MTIHEEHPFATPPADRDALRRVRGLLPAPVTVWTTGAGRRREGWTISSMMLADGAPDGGERAPEVIGLLDEHSDLADELEPGTPITVNVLGHGIASANLADAFARLAPAPGGPFTLGQWTDTDHGPRLDDAAAWVSAEIIDAATHAGWALLVRARVVSAERGTGDALRHERGRYVLD
ncbi:flavin reductase family protein [Propioniferax innocua]|uniref:Flavin reductase (DIM6/NTAB) family NADH-FMN oxidoreductase RutF n=1 Tax=Propioniferax innocua TaxID=1753 RepID=A0A542ZB55_9ACTN|nr:flavin reductase [Propioniferax innocua]TQL57575.1 flavin reductase (DIM6/NTAB) family NADH-FMN oxidoreductase RutF [Propioniferax innocua]